MEQCDETLYVVERALYASSRHLVGCVARSTRTRFADSIVWQYVSHFPPYGCPNGVLPEFGLHSFVFCARVSLPLAFQHV
uniref:Uncharacterized protein n=1 Tax=viral metagenome TaxID=1070528 RepID=A0A6C0C1L1_9ZZZZ